MAKRWRCLKAECRFFYSVGTRWQCTSLSLYRLSASLSLLGWLLFLATVWLQFILPAPSALTHTQNYSYSYVKLLLSLWCVERKAFIFVWEFRKIWQQAHSFGFLPVFIYLAGLSLSAPSPRRLAFRSNPDVCFHTDNIKLETKKQQLF